MDHPRRTDTARPKLARRRQTRVPTAIRGDQNAGHPAHGASSPAHGTAPRDRIAQTEAQQDVAKFAQATLKRPAIGKPKAPPKADRKRKGGQKSHSGAQRELLEPTEKIQRWPTSSCSCEGEWLKEEEQELFQVIDLPPKPTPDVTNFLISTHRCSGCKATHRPGYQPMLRYSPYGPRLHAYFWRVSSARRLMWNRRQRFEVAFCMLSRS